MGEASGDGIDVEPQPLWLVVVVGEFNERYGPFDSITDFYWSAGFVVGFLAAQGHTAADIKLLTYLGDTLIEET